MYSVSESYKNALLQKHITDTIEGEAVLKDGTVIALNDDTVISGSLKIIHELCDDYRIGGFNLGCMKIGFFDDSALLHDFSGAKIMLSYKMETEDGWESIPLGIFIADGQSVKRRRNTITLTAYDYGILFDCTLGSTIRSTNGTAEQIVKAVCERCGVTFGGIANGLPNKGVTFTPSSEQIQSCRDLIGWCADLLCGYAVIDREGKLKIISARYSVSADNPTEIITDKIITAAERNNIYSTDTRAWIARMSAHSGGKTKVYKSNITMDDSQAARAVYYLDKNPLLDDKSESECDEINCDWLEFVDSFMQRGITAELYGDPAIDVGDVIRCSGGDIDQRKSVVGLITRQEWHYRGFHNIICASAQLSDGFEETETEEEGSSETETVGETDEIYPVKVVEQSDKRMNGTKAAVSGVGAFVNDEKNAERFNDYSAAALAIPVGRYSHAEGIRTNAGGSGSHAEGCETEATGQYSHAEGDRSKATYLYSHAEGQTTTASGEASHSEGDGSAASALASHAEGIRTTSKGSGSHSEGYETTASGSSAHAEGSKTQATGDYSHSGGLGTIASGWAQTAIGKYNKEDDNTLFVIGGGTSDDDRQNVFTVDDSGNVHIAGNLTIDGTGGFDVPEYTAGSGISISDNEISVSIGNGLEYDAAGRVSLKEQEEAGGLVVENGIIIQEKDASYLLHEYTEVEYIQGNKLVYAGPKNQIIGSGYVCYNYNNATVNNLPLYQSMEFDDTLKYYYYPSSREFKKVELRLLTAGSGSSRWQIMGTLKNGSEYSIMDPFYHYGDISEVGFDFLWMSIFPAGTSGGFTFPYGWAQGAFAARYRGSSGGDLYLSKQNYSYYYMPFKSEAEYNAAVGLTYEPNKLTEIQETITEV